MVSKTPKMKMLKREVIYRGRIITLVREELEARGMHLVRDTIEHPGAVVIVPLLSQDRIVFVRQYRRAANKQLLELPAGTLEPKEPLLACAKRELQEETGWKAKCWKRLGSFYSAPGILAELLTVFLAWDLSAVPARPEADEWIEPETIALDKAIRQIEQGTICDAKTIVGIFLLQQHLKSKRAGS